MTIHSIELLMTRVSEVLMLPVLLMIILLFAYALFALGKFFSLALIRKKNAHQYQDSVKKQYFSPINGYELHNYFRQQPNSSEEELEVFALKRLEGLRVVTRIAPMLGLIATMIPMGPALKALADGNIQGISENLILAFAAVIWGLVASSITFWPASVQKRWLASELINTRKLREEA